MKYRISIRLNSIFNREDIYKKFSVVFITCLIVLTCTLASFAEGGSQFAADYLITPSGASRYVCQWNYWCFMGTKNLWNVFYVYAKPGETITVKDIYTYLNNKDGTLAIKYPNGTTSNVSFRASMQTHKINVTSANTPSNGGIFEIRINLPYEDGILSKYQFVVTDANGKEKKGRTFTYGFLFESKSLTNTIYVLTDEGIVFRVNTRKAEPLIAFMVSTKKGIYDPNTKEPIYHTIREEDLSYFRVAYPSTTYSSVFPKYSMEDSTHKFFFNYPDADLLNYLGLKNVKDGATVSNFKFSGDSDNHALPGKGGTFQFKANEVVGNYSFTINLGGSSKNITVGGVINKENFSIPWNGKDKQGNAVPEGTYTATLTTSVGETHFLLDDFEEGGGGWTFTQMNGKNAGSTKIYYNNAAATISGRKIEAAADKADRTVTPVDSGSGVFKSGINQQLIDVWMKQNENTYTIKFTISSIRDIQVSKQFSDYNNKFNTRPASVTFDAFAGSSTTSSGSCSASQSTSWKCTITGLQKNDASGNAITYTIKERTVPAGYTGNTASVNASATTATITNTLDTKDVVVTKSWVDQNNRFSTRPSSLVFHAYIGSGTTSMGSCTANASNSWKCTISGLAKVNASGDAITYTIKEAAVPSGYTQSTGSVTTANGTTATVTNTLQTKDIEVSKKWSDAENKFSTRPGSLIFDAFIGSGTASVGNCTANASNSWKCKITGLAKLDTAGKAISYTIKERTVPSGYTGTTATVATEAGNTASITNTLSTISISVNKTWVDNNDALKRRPTSLVFDVFIGNGTTSMGNCTANASNSWKCSISGLAKVDSANKAITYTIKERSTPAGYSATTAKVTSTAATPSAAITNTLLVKDITVSKTWSDNNNAYKTRPNSLIFDAFAGNSTTSSGNCTANAAGGWKCTIKELAIYDTSNKPIVYTIKERKIPGSYKANEPKVSTAEGSTATLTNTLETTEIEILKKWDDSKNVDNKRPKKITVNLLLGTKIIISVDLPKDEAERTKDEWSYKFTGIPKYDTNGNIAKYTVREVPTN